MTTAVASHSAIPPYQPQNQQVVNELAQTLEATSKRGGSKKGGISCRSTKFDIKDSPSKLSVQSWKFQDWDYKKRDLPTYARGLFTCKDPKSGNTEIVIRGYDKFFNIGEVEKTKWEHIELNTIGPYELTLKENGCIIFISGLSDDTLLVCSKHSTGDRGDASASHAMAGERWVDKQLKALGKTRKELAQALRKANATAVAELCDDNFEEHILAYESDKAGLYLHGINLNLPEFTTWSGGQVHAFADDWGFKKIEYFYKDNVMELKSFLEECAETGAYNGRDVEGFVIRCKGRDGPNATRYYDWFFKYKFEEPYLMYRQWREVTKALIAGKMPKIRKHKKITEQYISYARMRLREDTNLAKQYQLNHGIIAMRDGFLAHIGQKGSDIIKAEEDEEGSESAVKNLVLVPVATIGCGKTTIAVALTKLFPWGHIQNDNITVRKNKPQAFANAVCMEVQEFGVCIADRNNHQKRERKQLIDDVSAQIAGAKFVALHYVHYKAGSNLIGAIRERTEDRIFARGDAHQTIHAATNDKQFITGIMDGFLKRFEPVDTDTAPDEDFDVVIDLDPLADSRTNLETVLSNLHEHYPKLMNEMPTSEDIDDAIEAALKEYAPDIKHVIGGSGAGRLPSQGGQQGKGKQVIHGTGENSRPNNAPARKKTPRVEYFGTQVNTKSIITVLDNIFANQTPEVAQFYRQLQATRRVPLKFHATMIHRASSKTHPQIWAKYNDLQAALPSDTKSIDTLKVKLERVVWDSRVMTIVASTEEDKDYPTANEVLHITIGTASPDVKPKESNNMLHFWKDAGVGNGIYELVLGKNGAEIEIDGVLEAVSSRS